MTAARSPRSATASKIDLDLDTLERETAPDPITIKVAGRKITLVDPFEIDWQVLAMIDTGQAPMTTMQEIIPAEDFEHFLSAKLKGWQVNEIVTLWRERYTTLTPGNSAG